MYTLDIAIISFNAVYKAFIMLAFYLLQARSDGATAAIAGGVVGGLVGVVLIAVVVIVIVIILKNKQDSSQHGRSISLYPYCTITCLYS